MNLSVKYRYYGIFPLSMRKALVLNGGVMAVWMRQFGTWQAVEPATRHATNARTRRIILKSRMTAKGHRRLLTDPPAASAPRGRADGIAKSGLSPHRSGDSNCRRFMIHISGTRVEADVDHDAPDRRLVPIPDSLAIWPEDSSPTKADEARVGHATPVTAQNHNSALMDSPSTTA